MISNIGVRCSKCLGVSKLPYKCNRVIYSLFPRLVNNDFSENSFTFSVQFVQSKISAQWCSGMLWLALTSLILLSLVVVQKWVTFPLYPKIQYKSSPSQGQKNDILKLTLVQQNSYRQRGISHTICIWIVFSPSLHNKVWNTLTLKFDPFFSHTCTPPKSTQVFDLLCLRCSIIPHIASDKQSFPWDGVYFDSCYRNQFSG